MPEVRQERTGWRDESLSARHRQWGWDCPAFDIDFIMIEYNNSKVVALVEYKNEFAKPVDLRHPTMRALADLGDRAKVPIFVARYSSDFSTWVIEGVNGHAQSFWPVAKSISEYEWVTFLYSLRGRKIPKSVALQCIPPKKRVLSFGGEEFEANWFWVESDYATA